MNRDELIAAILPELGKVPMVDAPQSRIREIQAGWIADAILSRLQPSGDGELVAADGYAKAIEDAVDVVQRVDSWGLSGDALKAVIRQRTFIAKAIRALAGKDEA